MKKRILSLVLVLLLAFALLPFGAFADEHEGCLMYKIEDGAAIVTGLYVSPPEEGRLVIPETLGGAPVREIGQGAFANSKEVAEVVLPDSIEYIGPGAFQSSNVAKINIPANLRETGAGAFFYTLIMEDEGNWEDDVFYFGNTALKVRGEGTAIKLRPGTKYVNFQLEYPRMLTSVTIPEGVVKIGGDAFAAAERLKAVKLPDSLEYIGDRAFVGSALTSIAIPPHVKYIGVSAFSGCKLESITLSGNELETIEDWAFFNNPLRMDTLKIPNSVKRVGVSAFHGGIIKNLILSEGMTELTNSSFAGSNWLQTLRIPASIKTIGESALEGRINFNPDDPAYTTQVFYEGTESEWAKVTIGARNEPLGTMKVQCKAEPFVDPFLDVLQKEYYAEPVAWAVNHNPQITNGTGATTFSPNNPCTRGQIVTFLWRAAGQPDPKKTANPFGDVKADAYYYKAVLWAVEQGITNGTSATAFSPESPCTRAQVVTFLWRNAKQPKAAGSNPFSDVASGEYYYDAVLWAVRNEITNGIDATHFGPNNTCTRGQIVTFLYRDLAK